MDLALRGCGTCDIKAPDHPEALPFTPITFISRLVYRGGTCVGFLDRYGSLVVSTDKPFDVEHRRLVVLACLLSFQLISAVAAFASGTWFIVRRISAKSARLDG